MDGLMGGDDSSAEILENGGVDENTESPEVVVDDEVIGDNQDTTKTKVQESLDDAVLLETAASTDLSITESISSKSAHPQDVVQIKGALAALGYYQPDVRTGMTPYFDTNLGEAIRMYQRDAKLPITGMMTPDDSLTQKLNERLSFYPTGSKAAALDAYRGDYSKFIAYRETRGTETTGLFAPIKDMMRSYNDQTVADTVGADKYFHCKANYMASSRGKYGNLLSYVISFGKEVKDIPYYAVKNGLKESIKDTKKDWTSNNKGWLGAKEGKSLLEACGDDRPKGLSHKY